MRRWPPAAGGPTIWQTIPWRTQMNETPTQPFAEADDDHAAAPADADDSPPRQRRVEVACDPSVDDPQLADWLAGQLDRLVDQLALAEVELAVVVVADPRMAELHERFAGVTGTTDVLTFDLTGETAVGTRHPAPETRKHVEGEVYVCYDEAARQAADRTHGVDVELLLYAVHGLLHLLGYDDHDEAHHAEMHAREDELLEAIGVGRAFDDEGGRRHE